MFWLGVAYVLCCIVVGQAFIKDAIDSKRDHGYYGTVGDFLGGIALTFIPVLNFFCACIVTAVAFEESVTLQKVKIKWRELMLVKLGG